MRILLNPNQPNNIYTNFSSDKKSDLSVVKGAVEEAVLLKKNKEQSSNKSPVSSVTIAAIAAVSSVFVLSKGVQKNTNVILNKIKNFLEHRSASSSLKDSGKWKKFYEFSIRRLNSFMKKTESINNINSLKDILFMKLMYETRVTKAIHKSITNYFEKVSKKTVMKSYEKTKKYFDQMNKKFDELDEYILKNSADEIVEIDGNKYTKRQLIEEARNKRELSKMLVDAFIDKSTIENRYEYINKVTSSLYSKFWDVSFKDFWTKNNKFKHKEMWQTFIAAEQIRGNKTQFAAWSSTARNAVTYNEKDRISNIRECINALDSITPPRDKEGIEIIKRLSWFVKNPEIFHNNKEFFFKELNKLKEHRFPLSADDNILKTLEECKETNVKLIEKQITDNEPGLLQEMLTYYSKIAPFELEKSGALLSLKRAVNSFDKSLKLEGTDLFDKVRDLKLGSAPTDILTLLFSFVMLSFGLGHAKDKDKRTSIMLTSGIPIVGGIAATMYSTTKLVSGGKSLVFGILSGIVLNRLGVIVDNLRKNRKGNSK